MKITKVDNVRTAIVRKKGNKLEDVQGGRMYQSPKTDMNLSSKKDIERIVKRRIESAKKAHQSLLNGKKKQGKGQDNKSDSAPMTMEEFGIKMDRVLKCVPDGLLYQNLMIQPVKAGGEYVLAPAGVQDLDGVLSGLQEGIGIIAHEKANDITSANAVAGGKHRWKKTALAEFLFTYADLSDGIRMEMLRKLRRLLVLYFYGEDEVQKLDGDFDVWADHEDRKRCDVSFFKKWNKDNLDLLEELRNIRWRRYKESLGFIEKASEPSDIREKKPEGRFFSNPTWNRFWLDFIQAKVENHYKNKHFNAKEEDQQKLRLGILGERVWKEMLNYLSTYYVYMGKAVYMTSMEELTKKGDKKLGLIGKDYQKGITSFMLEEVKAREDLQRAVSVYTAFAINHFREALGATGDILIVSENGKSENEKLFQDKDKNRRRILQYFGGYSRWEAFFEARKKDSEIGSDAEDLARILQAVFTELRNKSFHFRTEKEKPQMNTLVSKMFEQDLRFESERLRERIHANNLPMFYESQKLKSVMTELYGAHVQRASQVPSFNKVLVRSDLPDFLRKLFGKLPVFDDVETQQQWQSGLYFLLKEVYYNHFLREENLAKSLFFKEMESMQKEAGKNFAISHFMKQYDSLPKDWSFSKVCQSFMTEYNRQNQGSRKVKSSEAVKKGYVPKDGFQHYRELLHKGIRQAFCAFLKNEKNGYGFLKTPRKKENGKMEDFLPDFHTDRSKEIAEKLRESAELQEWYLLGRMLSAKQVNHLAGAVRNYIQYRGDVEARAKGEGQQLPKGDGIASEELEGILRVLAVCIELAGIVSNNYTDYFENEEEYAVYVSQFLEFQYNGVSYASSLNSFCNEEVDGERIGIFYDGANPIVNRNVVLSKLYGVSCVLGNALKDRKVTREEILERRKNEGELVGYKKDGKVKTEEDQKKLIQYQRLTNHVEFKDILDYSELINELQSQLIDWSYLRERDLLYFQLGFHYCCLKGNHQRPKGYERLERNKQTIDGFALYQIAAMYIYGLKILSVKDETKWEWKTGQTGLKVPAYGKWGVKLLREAGMLPEGGVSDDKKEEDAFYLIGMELFENRKEHTDIIDLRNYVDHFSYYSQMGDKEDKGTLGRAYSLLEIYSEMFDRFFSYDSRLRKNSPNMLYNLLLQYLVNVKFEFGTGKKRIGDREKDAALLQIRFAKSEKFTYKLADGGTVTLDARNKVYVENVLRILYYPNVPEDIRNKIVEE